MARGFPPRRKTSVCLAVTLLWGGLMAWHVQKQFGAFWGCRGASGAVPRRGLILPEDGTQGILRMGVFLGSRRVGALEQRWIRQEGTLTVEARMNVALDALVSRASLPPNEASFEDALDVRVDSRSVLVGQELETLSVFARIGHQPDPFASVQGRKENGGLALDIQRGKSVETAFVPLLGDSGVDLACFPLVALPRLRKGMSWPVASFDPATLRVAKSKARVAGREDLPQQNGGGAFVIRIGKGRRGATIWAAEDGQILRKALMGLTFVRESDFEPAPTYLAATWEGAP